MIIIEFIAKQDDYTKVQMAVSNPDKCLNVISILDDSPAVQCWKVLGVDSLYKEYGWCNTCWKKYRQGSYTTEDFGSE